jgi:hypothetical protein
MRTLKVIYIEGGVESPPLDIVLSASIPSPLVDGALTIQGVVAVVDSAITGIVRGI